MDEHRVTRVAPIGRPVGATLGGAGTLTRCVARVTLGAGIEIITEPSEIIEAMLEIVGKIEFQVSRFLLGELEDLSISQGPQKVKGD